MNDQEIYKKIEDTYNSEKGKNFITHLLRSFIPINRSSKLMDDTRKLKLVDCITGEKLCDVNQHFGIMMDGGGIEAMMDNLKASAKATVDGKEEYDAPESVKKLRSKLKPLAITSAKSDKLMTQETLEQLFNFYATEMLKGNGHINWIANNERGKDMVNAGKKSGYIKNDHEAKVVKKATERAKMSLGDMSVLQELKQRMEDDD